MATKWSRSFGWLSLCLVAACSDMDTPTGIGPTDHADAPGTSANASYANPLTGRTLYVQPSNRALAQAEKWALTRPADAELMERIGHTAQSVWFGNWNADVEYAARKYVKAAALVSALPVLVAYNIPQRDCGSYSAGGSASADAYRTWIRALAAGIGSRRAVVILEPDALAGMSCLSTTDRGRRVSLLADAITVLKANAATTVYLDAGHPRWISTSEMARRLTSANLAAADGFSLNVSNFIGSSENVTYGAALSSLVGGKHFVIDTSRNGRGPTATNEWCNPAGRGLGMTPTTASGHPLVDALLWIKRPGESDGTCNGGPVAGTWWASYALGLAERATTVIALN